MFGLVEILLQGLEELGSQVAETPVELAQLDQAVLDILGLERSEGVAQSNGDLGNLLDRRVHKRGKLNLVGDLVRHCCY